MTKRALLVLLSLWWGWTVIIDFAVVPTVFRTIHDFFNAGELGIALFSKLNALELLVSSALVITAGFQVKKTGQGKWQLALLCVCLLIVLSYIGYLTPKLTTLTDLWKAADAKGELGISGIADIQQEHQLYHRIYVGLDTLKLGLLSVLLGFNAKA